jgi:hypothetical protein
MTRVVLPIIFIIFGLFAVNSNASPFYRPLPQFLDKTVNKVLMKQLDERFGPGNFPTPSRTPATTPSTAPATTASTIKSELQDIMGIECVEHFKKCSSKKMAKFLSLIKRLQKFSRLIRNDKRNVTPIHIS